MFPPQSSLAELQEMTRCLRHYCSVFSSMEEHLCEEQAESYQLLSEQDRWVGGLRSALQTVRIKQYLKNIQYQGSQHDRRKCVKMKSRVKVCLMENITAVAANKREVCCFVGHLASEEMSQSFPLCRLSKARSHDEIHIKTAICSYISMNVCLQLLFLS